MRESIWRGTSFWFSSAKISVVLFSFNLLTSTQLFFGSSLPSSPSFYNGKIKGPVNRTRAQCGSVPAPTPHPVQCLRTVS